MVRWKNSRVWVDSASFGISFDYSLILWQLVLLCFRLSHNQVARSKQHTPGNIPKPCSAASLGVGLVFFPLGDAERYVPLVFFSSHFNEIQKEWWLFYQKRISVELTSFLLPWSKPPKKRQGLSFWWAFPMKNRPWKKLFYFDRFQRPTDLAFSPICDVAPDDRRITTFMTMMSAEVLMERADLSYGKRVTGLAEIYFF